MDINAKKNNYNAPTIKVVSFNVEEGFQATLKVGDQGDSEAQPPIEPTQGTEYFNFSTLSSN